MEEWHYTDLLKAHDCFTRVEGRFRVYDAYMEAREPGVWVHSRNVPLKEGLLLFGWVHSWDPNFEGDLGRFYDIHDHIYDVLRAFRDETLVGIDLNDDTKNSLCALFDSVASCCRTSRFESTDASKMLHAIIPELFVMWDHAIRRGVLGDSNRKRGEDYAQWFLPKMQESAKIFLDTYMGEQGGTYEEASTKLASMAGGNTLAKLLDELNYLKFTKKIPMALIRR